MMDASGFPSSRSKRKARPKDVCTDEAPKLAKHAESDPQTSASIASSKISVQRCIEEVEMAQVVTSSKDLCSLLIDAKQLVDTIDRAILAACQREKEQAVCQAASLGTREVERLRWEREEGQKAVVAEISKLREERSTVEAIAAAERIKNVMDRSIHPADRSRLEDEMTCFFRYLSSS